MIEKFTPISRFMTPNPLSIDASLSVADARTRMANERVRHLPVTRDGALVGIVTARDLMVLESLAAINVREATVELAMTANPRTCHETTSLGEVLSVMEDTAVGAVPVLDDNNKVVGIFTAVDGIRVLRDALV